MLRDLRTLYQYRDLMLSWTQRTLKVRYKQSLLGIAWAILQPLSVMLLFTLVFSVFIRVPTNGIPYPVFSYCALLPWTFFANSLTQAIPSLERNMNLVTKVYFPREIIPIATILASLVDFGVASVVFAGLMVFYDVPASWTLLLVPAVLAIQVLLTLGVGLFGSAVNVYYRDVRFIVPLALQLWLYASPIIYPPTLVPEWLQQFYWLNPMAGIVESYRALILRAEWPQPLPLVLAAAFSMLAFIAGYTYFKRAEMTFADVI